MTKIKDVVAHLESLAPPMYQESYDNSGLIVGNPKAEVTGVLLCLDSIESVIDEADEDDGDDDDAVDDESSSGGGGAADHRGQARRSDCLCTRAARGL